MNKSIHNCYLYQHRRKDSGEIFYVGVGYSKNYRRAYDGKKRSTLWKELVAKYGRTVEILATDLTLEDAYTREKELITRYGRLDIGTGPLVNQVDGGGGRFNPSPEVRFEQSERAKGNKHKLGYPSPMKGKRHSKESRRRMSATQVGRQHPESTRLKMSEVRKGKVSGNARLIINIETGIFYQGVREAAFSININPNSLDNQLRGYRKNKTSLIFC